MNKKVVTYLTAMLLCAASFWAIGDRQTTTVQAATHTLTKTVMHNAQAYSRLGKKVKGSYPAFSTIIVDDQLVIIGTQPHAPYYKIANKKRYIKASNIDGVKRKLTQNSYVYVSSRQKAGTKVIKKGSTITTYGSAYRFKNGQLYYRVSGPQRQYIKAKNLGPVTGSSTEETTVTVINSRGTAIYKDEDNIDTINKRVKKGTKFRVDRCEEGSRAEYIENIIGQFVPNAVIYRIKGTTHWLWGLDVKANKKLPVHDYNAENFTYIRFNQDVNVYNADGTMQDHHGQKIRKQGGSFKVNKLLYIWVPTENKVELFYHLVGDEFYSTHPEVSEKIEVGDAYVKQNEVEFFLGIKLKPSNTVQDALNQAKQNNSN
ncbi:SLAP domain-containing protein [Lactobacillus xylocopicola]|uniref:S-layer protein C-terminal domain-containing protein n=1 Tax=Lactobacillus xylocopicola TaxID=2976676 RepID=A0ABM8BIL0_9LACO|nr:SLAP domain-containing protein [Lactobacillus xylocopicola]BDR61155.1 hypothetical protein KIM322_14160 [Lactobacillus xylocopicola]